MSRSAREIAEIKNAVRNLKLHDLQTICNFANCLKGGRKQEILDRILQYLDDDPSFAVKMKIRELCKKANSGAPIPRVNAPSSGPSTSEISGTTHHVSGLPMPNIRPHPGSSTSNQMNFSSHVSVAQNQMHQTNLPVHPDVRLAPHPFYEQQQNGELMRIKTLMNISRPFLAKGVYETTFPFHLTPQQANMIFENRVEHIVQKRTDFGIQVLVRFCKYDTNGEQEDALPIHLSLRCNGTPVPLCNPIPTNKPGMDGRRLGRPINITPQVRVSPTVPNFITVTWHYDPNHHLQSQIYALGVYLVKRLSPKDLMNKLNKKGVKPAEFAKYMIKEKMKNADCEILTNKLRTSLRCPLGKTRIDIPLRGKRCTHLQCFDAFCYLAMNERRPTWRCPYCDQPSPYFELYIDGFYKDVLSRCDSSVNTVEFSEDGSWLAVREDEDDEEEDEPPPPPKPSVSAPPPKNPAPLVTPQPPSVVVPSLSEGDTAASGDASVIDLTEGSDEESASANNGSVNEPTRQGTKREMEPCDGPASKRPNVSTSPEIICLDSSDDDEDTSARPSSPKNTNGKANMEAPDSTTPVSSNSLDAVGTSKTSASETGVPVSKPSDPSAPSSLFTNGQTQEFPVTSNASSGTLFPSQFVSSAPVFPGPPNDFYQT